jgi:hypothetical protein
MFTDPNLGNSRNFDRINALPSIPQLKKQLSKQLKFHPSSYPNNNIFPLKDEISPIIFQNIIATKSIEDGLIYLITAHASQSVKGMHYTNIYPSSHRLQLYNLEFNTESNPLRINATCIASHSIVSGIPMGDLSGQRDSLHQSLSKSEYIITLKRRNINSPWEFNIDTTDFRDQNMCEEILSNMIKSHTDVFSTNSTSRFLEHMDEHWIYVYDVKTKEGFSQDGFLVFIPEDQNEKLHVYPYKQSGFFENFSHMIRNINSNLDDIKVPIDEA